MQPPVHAASEAYGGNFIPQVTFTGSLAAIPPDSIKLLRRDNLTARRGEKRA